MSRASVPQELSASITPELAPQIVHGYVSPRILRTLAEDKGATIPDTFAALLPTRPHLQSGDFGEMLFVAALQHRDPPLRFPVYRWRFRMSRNSTVMGVDLVGYRLAGLQPAASDELVLCEVKTRSKKSSKARSKQVVKQAYDAVVKDHTTRLGNQLLFQLKALRESNEHEEADRLSRFLNPHKAGFTFSTRLIAAVLHESAHWQDVFLDELPGSHNSAVAVDVALILADDLASWIASSLEASVRCSSECARTCENGCTEVCRSPQSISLPAPLLPPPNSLSDA